MFNAAYKKEALAGLNEANDEYNKKFESAVKNITVLHNTRLESINVLKDIEEY